jgi:hypothetical protein
MEQEILHLEIEAMRNGVLFKKEFAYTSDHLVFQRTSWMENSDDGWKTKGWFRINGPDGTPLTISNEALVSLASAASRKGWEVIWNPEYSLDSTECVKKSLFH